MRPKPVSLVLAFTFFALEARSEAVNAAEEDGAKSVLEGSADAAPAAGVEVSATPEVSAGSGSEPGVRDSAETLPESREASESAPPVESSRVSGSEAPSPSEDPLLSSRPPRTERRDEMATSDGVGFLRNRFRLGLRLGWASTTEQSWGLVGAGLGYYVFDGVEAMVDGDAWIGSPAIFVVTPALRYVFYWLPDVKPYVGPLYRHYFRTDGSPDTDAVGARVGVYFMLSRTAYVGGGLFYEHRLDDFLFAKRDAVFPEISLSFSF